jgi:hypothetical protein
MEQAPDWMTKGKTIAGLIEEHPLGRPWRAAAPAADRNLE